MASEPNIEELTVHAAVDRLTRRECSSEDLVAGLLDVIRRRDDDVGAYLELDEDAALEQAKAADAARAEGRSGRLLGVPVAVKDVLNVRGQPCTCASRVLESFNPRP